MSDELGVQADPSAGVKVKKGVTQKAMGGLFWTFSGTGLRALFQVLFVAVLGRLLSPEDFGLFGIVVIVVNFAQIFTEVGIGPALVQRPDIREEHLKTAFSISVLSGAFLVIVVMAAAPWIAAFFHADAATALIRGIAPIFLIKSLAAVPESLVQRNLKFRLLIIIPTATYVLGYGLVGLPLAYLGFGSWSLVGAALAQGVLAAIGFMAVQPHPKSLLIETSALKELAFFGSGLTLAKISDYFAQQLDNMVVGRWLGTEALGLYGRAYQLMVMPVTLLGQATNRVLFPAMASVQKDKERLAIAYRRNLNVTAMILLPVSAVILVLTPEIVRIVLGPKWGGVITPLRILALGTFFRMGHRIGSALARAKGAVFEFAWRNTVYAVLVLVGAWIGRPWGLAGVAAGVVFALFVYFMMIAQLCIRLTGQTWKVFGAAHARPAVMGVISFVVVFFAANLFRSWGFSSILVLAASLGFILILFLLAILLSAEWTLGQDGLWLFKTVSTSLRDRESKPRFKIGVKREQPVP